MRKLWNSLRRWEKIFLVISPILAAPIVAGVIYGIYLDFQPPRLCLPCRNKLSATHTTSASRGRMFMSTQLESLTGAIMKNGEGYRRTIITMKL